MIKKKHKTLHNKGRRGFFFSWFICLFLSFPLSSQIYIKDSSSLFISENTIVFGIQQQEEISVFVIKGTTIVNLQKLINSKIFFIGNSTNKNQSVALHLKNTHKKKNSKSTKNEVILKNRVYKNNDDKKDTFLAKDQNFASSNGRQFPIRLANNFYKKEILFLTKSEIGLICYTKKENANNFSFSIRPPPYL